MTKLLSTVAAALLVASPVLAQSTGMGDMTDYDTDSDQMLSDTEFMESQGDRRFMDYDADQSGDISQEEFNAGEFRRYDANVDDMLDSDEYGRAQEDDSMMMERDG